MMNVTDNAIDTNPVAMASKWLLLADDDQDDIFLFQEALKHNPNQPELRIANDGFEVIVSLRQNPSC